MKIERYNEFIVNEIFGFGKPLQYDNVAKDNFKKLLDDLDNVKVVKYADYKREVVLNLKEEESRETNRKIDNSTSEGESKNIKEGQVVGLKKKNTSVSYTPQTSLHDAIKKPDYSKLTKIEVMKNYSKHRISSKIFGVGKEDSYSLAINGKHFISDIRGEEGKILVSNKLTKLFWDLLSELWILQEDLRKNLIKEPDYKKKVSELKNKYTNLLNKLK